MRREVRAGALAFVWIAVAGAAVAEGPAALRVGTSFDYAPFSQGSPEAPAGFDVELLRAYARERGRALEWVRMRWPELVADLTAGRFDVAAGGVTVRPERSVAGIFSVPVATTGAVVLVKDTARFRVGADLDRPEVRIAVNQGGHLERVARQLFPSARLLPSPDNARVPDALRRGDADAALTDSAEAPRWRASAPGWGMIGPLTRDWKAWLVAPGRAELAADLDLWLLAREADGRLGALRRVHLGAQAEPTALPLPALLAALSQRLDLAPLVAESKREAGLPVRDAAQEERVRSALLAAARDEARRTGAAAPDEAALGALVSALLAASRELQSATLAGPPGPVRGAEPPGPVRGAEPPGARPRFDLDAQLRPALTRLGERIARLVVRLPDAAPPDATSEDPVREQVRRELARPGLSDESVAALADAVAALTRGPARRAGGSLPRRAPGRPCAGPGRRSLRT